jgi:hypothetical protein
MWERLGGYNQKYAPDGCGAEDAELWLRAGAYGWNAKKATDEPLFVYHLEPLFVYHLGGYVTGNPNYVEPPWLDMHPWTQDRLHPFASMATPAKLSHPIRQYDEPAVSVIIPVGPSHEDKVRDALNSLEAQTFRGWEAIVVLDLPSGIKPCAPRNVPWQNNKVKFRYDPALESLWTAYPYVRWCMDFKPSQGAGWARNRGAEIARAPFLLFLDADDELYPTHIEKYLKAWKEHQAIIYSDYVGKAQPSPAQTASAGWILTAKKRSASPRRRAMPICHTTTGASLPRWCRKRGTMK